MEGPYLGKITFAEYGQNPDRPFLFGLHLHFEFGGGGVGDGGKYTFNASKECKWDNEQKRMFVVFNGLEHLNKTLTHAKVNYVSQLVGKPVEITIVNNMFKDFRILTEVL